ncbi:MAG: serine hydrolase [Alphaproteobacteria bacterium]|nr:serine hydrolase [Alphaproteobacteria bacterium]
MRMAALGLALLAGPVAAQTTASELEGLWVVQRDYAPVLRGDLEISRDGDTWRGSIGGEQAEAQTEGGEVRLSFANHGAFRGRVARNGTLSGVWIQPNSDAEERDDPTAASQSFASPLVLARHGSVWRANVRPLDGRFTVYLRIFRDSEGHLIGAFRNHEINSRGGASQFRVSEEGDAISFVASLDGGQEVRRDATHLRDPERIRIFWPDLGSDLEWHRASVAEAVNYSPRPQNEPAYTYRRPEQLRDGWRTARAQSVGIDEAALTTMVQSIVDGDPSARRPNLIHSMLVAHRGRLVLEEYFHRYTRETPHDIRSAGKTFASIMLGAAMESGAPISPETPVYQLMAGLGPFDNPDPRKAHMTLAHLLTHTSGLACNDNDDASPGNEGVLWGQSNPNFWQYTLNLPQVHEPGERYAYCSANLNLVGGALNAATHESLPELFDRIIARPLQFGPYYWNVMPNGEGYLGGGAYLRPRDLLKVGQMYLDGGVWRGQRIVSREWVERSTSPRIDISPATTGLTQEEFENFYSPGVDGYAWHRYGVHVGDRTVEEYEANGNGGQFLIVVPEYDLVVVFTGGNYMQGGIWSRWRDQFIGGVIIPAMAN